MFSWLTVRLFQNSTGAALDKRRALRCNDYEVVDGQGLGRGLPGCTRTSGTPNEYLAGVFSRGVQLPVLKTWGRLALYCIHYCQNVCACYPAIPRTCFVYRSFSMQPIAVLKPSVTRSGPVLETGTSFSGTALFTIIHVFSASVTCCVYLCLRLAMSRSEWMYLVLGSKVHPFVVKGEAFVSWATQQFQTAVLSQVSYDMVQSLKLRSVDTGLPVRIKCVFQQRLDGSNTVLDSVQRLEC